MTKIEDYKTPKSFLGRYADPVKNILGKNFEVDGWITSEFVMRELVPIVGFHPYPLPELFLLTAVCCWYKPRYIFEWGTNVGKSARIFHEISTKFGLKAKVYTVDLPEISTHPELPKEDQLGYFIKNVPEVFSLRGDGLDESLKIIRQEKLKNSRLLFFLDGDHSFRAVNHELTTIYSRLNKACVLVHDTLDQTSESGYNLGPRQAINTLLDRDKKRRILVETTMSLPGMTAIL